MLRESKSPVSSAIFAATFSAKPILEFSPVPTAVPPEKYTRYIKYYYNEKHVNLSLNLFFFDLLYNSFFAGC